jgi:hypothetical protein
MRRYLSLLFAALLVAAVAAPAFAWEFSMSGSHEERFLYFSRTGEADLFGQAGMQDGGYTLPAGVSVGFAGPDTYLPNAVPLTGFGEAGAAAVRGGFSTWGSEGKLHQTRTVLKPVIRVNKAIRVFGTYNIGGYRNKVLPANNPGIPPFEDYYMHRTSTAATNTAAIGAFTQLRATVQIPWGVLSYGVKDFPLGTGANLAYNTRADAFLTVVPYGPFRFLWALWLVRGADDGQGVRADDDWKFDLLQGFIMTYDNANMSMGAGTIQVRDHRRPAVFGATIDFVRQVYLAYFKYNNGRFFANAEYYWRTDDTTTIQAPEQHLEAYNWFSELGTVVGPMKLSTMFAMSSGPVANNTNPTKVYGIQPINYQAIAPYNTLMFLTYGGGNQTYNADGTGQMGDAYALAARFDYAVASNLNVWGSYMWAHRLETNGNLAGYVSSTGAANAGWTTANAQDWKQNYTGIAGLNPFIDDGFIGYEMQAGVDWKLLEGLTFMSKYAYWQPGEWFNQAYQAVAPIGGAASTVGYMDARDAIHTFQGSLLIEF